MRPHKAIPQTVCFRCWYEMRLSELQRIRLEFNLKKTCATNPNKGKRLQDSREKYNIVCAYKLWTQCDAFLHLFQNSFLLLFMFFFLLNIFKLRLICSYYNFVSIILLILITRVPSTPNTICRIWHIFIISPKLFQ